MLFGSVAGGIGIVFGILEVSESTTIIIVYSPEHIPWYTLHVIGTWYMSLPCTESDINFMTEITSRGCG